MPLFILYSLPAPLPTPQPNKGGLALLSSTRFCIVLPSPLPIYSFFHSVTLQSCLRFETRMEKGISVTHLHWGLAKAGGRLKLAGGLGLLLWDASKGQGR